MHLEQSGIGLPDEAYYREDHYAPIREAYVDMVAKQLRLAGYGDEETTRAQADRFLDVETRIAANHWDNVATRDSQKTYNPTDFATLSDELAHFDIAAWADAWQGAYDATPGGEDPAGGPDGRAAAHHRPRAQLPQGLRRLLEQR